MQEKLLRPSPLLRQNYFMPPFFCLLFEPQEEEVASQSIKQEKYGNIGDNTKNQAAEQGEGSTKNKNNDVKAKTPLLSSHCHMELCTSILTISGLLCRLFLQSDDCKMSYNRCSFIVEYYIEGVVRLFFPPIFYAFFDIKIKQSIIKIV